MLAKNYNNIKQKNAKICLLSHLHHQIVKLYKRILIILSSTLTKNNNKINFISCVEL